MVPSISIQGPVTKCSLSSHDLQTQHSSSLSKDPLPLDSIDIGDPIQQLVRIRREEPRVIALSVRDPGQKTQHSQQQNISTYHFSSSLRCRLSHGWPGPERPGGPAPLYTRRLVPFPRLTDDARSSAMSGGLYDL